MMKTFWAPKLNCEKRLNEEDRKVVDHIKGSREGKVSSLDVVTVAQTNEKYKRFCSGKKKTR